MKLLEFKKLIGELWFNELLFGQGEVYFNSSSKEFWIICPDKISNIGFGHPFSKNFKCDNFPPEFLKLEKRYQNHCNQTIEVFSMKEKYKQLAIFK